MGMKPTGPLEGLIMTSARGGRGTLQQWPSSPDDNPTCEEGSLKIQRPPLKGNDISPPEHHKGSRA